MSDLNLEDLVSLCKRRGFIYQGSEVYGGLAGTWDYGPLGVAVKRNIVNAWWRMFVEEPTNMYGLDSAIIMNPKVWEASGHTATFTDPLVVDKQTNRSYRLDHLLKDKGINPDGMSLKDMTSALKENKIKSPEGNDLSDPKLFNLMFSTNVGAIDTDTSKAYLRPETAQGMFVNFKNVVDSFYPDLPFGIAQVGRNFRNEISPRDFVFRSREFEIMELEYFIKPDQWEKEFEYLHNLMKKWFTEVLKLSQENIKEIEVPEADRAHYSSRTIDFEYKYPNGFDEIAGLAYRSDYDLSQHQKYSGKSFEYLIKGSNERFIPHVIEPTFGVDRSVLALLTEAYKVDEIGGEKRFYLALPYEFAPYKLAVFPLLKNKPELVSKAQDIFKHLQSTARAVLWDDNGNIGKRYRRQDEIGTPYCVTVDFQTLEDNTVTLRNRNTTVQTRIKIEEVISNLK